MVRARLSGSVSVLAALLVASSVAGAWERAPLPASHARVTAFSLAPSLPQRTYVALRGLGVWRTDSAGAFWTDRSAGLPPDAVILALEVSPLGPDWVWVGTEATAAGPGTVYRSTDGGVSWAVSGAGLAGASVQAFETVAGSPLLVYAGLSGGSQPGAYRSTDGGVTWSHISGSIPGEDIYVLAAKPGEPSTIVAGTRTGSARTTDGGATWTASDGGYGYRFLSWNPVDTSRLYGTRVDPAIFANPSVTTDDGSTWSRLMSLPYVSAAQPVAAHPTNAQTVFVGGWQSVGSLGGVVQQIWRTTDGGATFADIFSTAHGHRMTGLQVDPLNPANLYLGEEAPDGRGFRASSDGGASWSLRIDGLSNYDVGTLAEAPSGRMHALWNERCFVSTGDPTAWTDQGYQTPGGAYRGRVDGLVAAPVGDTLFRWGYWNDSDIDGYYLWKSSEAGAYWWDWGSPMPPYLDSFQPIRDVAVDPATAQRVYVSQSSTGLFRNDSGGGEFGDGEYTLINSALPDVELAVHPADPLTVFAAGGPLTVEVSFDGGATTSARNSGLPSEVGELEIAELFLEDADPDHLVVVYSDGRVYETRDAGLSWLLRAALDLGGAAIEDASWDPASGHVFLATLGQGLVTSHPAVPAGLPTAVTRSVHYSPLQQALFVGTENAGLWYAAIPPVVGAPELAEGAAPGLAVRPNPFAGVTTISLSVPAGGGDVRVTVHDAAGRLVREFRGGRRAAGTHEIAWDGRGNGGRTLAAGVYFVRATSGPAVATRKVVLLR